MLAVICSMDAVVSSTEAACSLDDCDSDCAVALRSERSVEFVRPVRLVARLRNASEPVVAVAGFSAMVLEAPFTAVVDRGAELFPWAPVRWLMPVPAWC